MITCEKRERERETYTMICQGIGPKIWTKKKKKKKEKIYNLPNHDYYRG